MRDKIGYAIGFVGQGSCYNFIGSYFILFLTDCVMLDAGIASSIASVALFVEAIAGMIVGNISDHFNSPMGRRRPFILLSGIILPIVLVCISTTIHQPKSIQIAYYLIFAILFRIFFSNFEIPYSAFGAEVARGYDERTKLRTITRIFGISGNAIGYVGPVLILSFFEDNREAGWATVGRVIAISVFVFLTVSVYLTKNVKSVPSENAVKQKNLFGEILKNYYQLAKLKPMKLLIIYKAAFGSAFTLYNASMIFYLKYSLGFSDSYSSAFYALQIGVFFAMTYFVNKMALAMGKAIQQFTTMVAGAIIGIIIYLVAPSNPIGGILYICVFSTVQTGFWQVSNSIFYDVVEVDEWVNGLRREGDVMSMVSVLGTVVMAVVTQIFGIILNNSGYAPEQNVQSSSTVAMLNTVYMLLPCILLFIAAFSLKLLPINKKTFKSLQDALKARSEGKDYSEYMEDVTFIVGKQHIVSR